MLSENRSFGSAQGAGAGSDRAAPSASVGNRFRLLRSFDDPTTVVDFSGWPLVVHEKFPDDLAYHIVGVFDRIREEIPCDAAEVPSMKSLCTSVESKGSSPKLTSSSLQTLPQRF